MENYSWLNDVGLLFAYSVLLLGLLMLNNILAFELDKRNFFGLNKYGLDGTEIARKLAHVISGLSLSVLPLLGASYLVPLFIGVGFMALLIATKLGFLQSLNLNYLHKKRSGAILFPLALVLMSLFFYQSAKIYMISMLILAVSDPLAAVFGMRFGRKKLLGKSFVGFSVFAISAFTILVSTDKFFSHSESAYLGFFAISIAVAVCEFFSRKGLDNLVIPVATSLLLGLL